jgi:hypothetical protein
MRRGDTSAICQSACKPSCWSATSRRCSPPRSYLARVPRAARARPPRRPAAPSLIFSVGRVPFWGLDRPFYIAGPSIGTFARFSGGGCHISGPWMTFLGCQGRFLWPMGCPAGIRASQCLRRLNPFPSLLARIGCSNTFCWTRRGRGTNSGACLSVCCRSLSASRWLSLRSRSWRRWSCLRCGSSRVIGRCGTRGARNRRSRCGKEIDPLDMRNHTQHLLRASRVAERFVREPYRSLHQAASLLAHHSFSVLGTLVPLLACALVALLLVGVWRVWGRRGLAMEGRCFEVRLGERVSRAAWSP